MSETMTDPQTKAERIAMARNLRPDSLYTTDSKGRTLEIVKLGPAAMLNVIEMAGGAAADNATWMRLALTLSSLKSIDGVPVRPISNKAQFLKLADEIGNEGLIAISEATTGTSDTGDATPDTAAEAREAELAASRSS